MRTHSKSSGLSFGLSLGLARRFALRSLVALPLLALAPAACTVHAETNVDVDQDVAFELGDLDGTCAGSGRSETADGVTTWTKTPVGERCQIDAAWTGTLMDMAEVKLKAEEQAGDVTLTIKGIHLAFDTAALRDAAGADLTPPRVPAWEAHFTLAGQPLGDFGGTDVTSLIAAPLELDVPPDGVALANQALTAGAQLTGSGTARLLVEMADVEALGAADAPALEFHFTGRVNAEAAKDLL